jgi:hypothetical protein
MPHALPKGKIVRATEKAVLYEYDGKSLWVPQSVVHDDSDIWKQDDEGVLKVKAWWAEKNDLP